jgi:type IV secretion system protein VirD4
MATQKREKTRHAGGLRLMHLGGAILTVIIGFWVAAQYIASALAYQPELGPPMFSVFNYPIYAPWSYFPWLWNYGAYAPSIFNRAIVIIGAFTLLGVGIAVFIAVRRTRAVEDATTYGTARWANDKDLVQSGLVGSEGVCLGLTEDGQYLTHNGPEHIEVTAPSRSGKGVGIVVPTLLTWRHSVVINDIKGENWTLTAGYRRRFGYVFKFNPAFPDSCRYNPLNEIRPGAFEVKDAQNVTDMIVDPDGKGKPDHWSKEADGWLLSVVLHVLYAEPNKTLSGIAAFLDNPERSVKATLQYMLATKHLGDSVHPVVAIGARAMLNKSDNERSGVHSTARSFFGLYLDPIVSAATSESDFRLSDLMQGDHPMSLYLIAPPSDKSRLRPLFRLILNQISRRLTEELNPEGNKWRLLLLVDEFPSLGKLEFFEEGLGFVAGYGIKVMMINQSVNQILKYYGPTNTVMDGAHVHVYYAPNTDETAKKISDTLGVTTEIHQQVNYTGSRMALWNAHQMVTNSETARPLLTPGEVRELSPADEIIIVAGLPPILAKKIKYFTNPRFKNLVPPTENSGRVSDPNHKYAPPQDTAKRPYRYGPKQPISPWHGRLIRPETVLADMQTNETREIEREMTNDENNEVTELAKQPVQTASREDDNGQEAAKMWDFTP